MLTLDIRTPDGTAMPVRVKDPSVPTSPCTSPPEVQEIRRVLAGLRRWNPVDWEQVYDDLDRVLHGESEVSHHAAGPSGAAPLPKYDNVEAVADRFHHALLQLVHRSLREDAHRTHPDIAILVEQAHTLIPEKLPGDPSPALGHLRKLSAVILQLAECLEETGIVKGLVEC